MPNIFGPAERLYKRFAGGNQKLLRKVDSRYNDDTTASCSNPIGSESTSTWKRLPYRANSSSNLTISSRSKSIDHLSALKSASPMAKPPGDLTEVSSESDDGVDSATNLTERKFIEPRTERIRQSLQRAKAAEFEMTTESQNRYPSAEHLYTQNVDDDDEDDDGDEENREDGPPGDVEDESEGEEAAEVEAEGVGLEADDQDSAYARPRRCAGGREGKEERDGLASAPRAFVSPQTLSSRGGVRWSPDPPQPLVEILRKIRHARSSPGTEFVRAFCQNQSCRCLLRGHDTLMLFPLFDAVLCESTWEKIKESQSFSSSSSLSVSTFSTRITPHFLTRLHLHSSGASSETLANLIMFRQCRGWYEVMNENHEPVPHWTTTEEVRCAKPAIFLVRRDLRCLLAPCELWLPPQICDRLESNAKSANSGNGAPPPILIPSKTVLEAANPRTIAASTSFILKPGTLLSYVDCLHECTVTRGKKTKQIALILAVEKNRVQRGGETPSTPRRLFYIGTEDASSQAVFPPKLALSPIAGPENISGVHMLHALLRKFRLPLSIVPVAVPERRASQNGSNLSNLSADSDSSTYATAQSSKPVNLFPTLPGVIFTERNYIRLRGLLRGDIMIVAPVDSPDRFFLITSTLLPDHLFQIGSTEDERYQRLATAHKNRTMNFISMAHPRESLDYLLAHLENITNRPRVVPTAQSKGESEGKELWRRLNSGALQTFQLTPPMVKAIYAETGRDPRSGPESSLSPDELDLMYDEMDDLYFFTRKGYFPPTARQRRIKSVSSSSQYPTSAGAARVGGGVGAGEPSRPSAIPSSEQLLAAYLNSPTFK